MCKDKSRNGREGRIQVMNLKKQRKDANINLNHEKLSEIFHILGRKLACLKDNTFPLILIS